MLHDKITQVSLAFSKLNGWLNLFVHRGTFYHIRSNFVVRHNCVLAMFTNAVGLPASVWFMWFDLAPKSCCVNESYLNFISHPNFAQSLLCVFLETIN